MSVTNSCGGNLPMPLARVIEALDTRRCKPRHRGEWKFRAMCPSHDDRNPSLVISYRDGRVLLYDHGGCSTRSVVAALGLTMAQLHAERRPAAPRMRAQRERMVHCYVDRDGVIVAEKVRVGHGRDKRVYWRVPDADAPGGYRWNLAGVVLPSLYNLPALVGQRSLIWNEGERAVDVLTRLQCPIASTCPPFGASVAQWQTRHTANDLWSAGCRELFIVLDADAPGQRIAQAVAESCAARRITARMVTLPGVGEAGDVVDYLAVADAPGERLATFLALLERAPEWSPVATTDRKRELARLRQQKRRSALREAAHAV